MAAPMIDDSAIGVLKQRSAPEPVGQALGGLEDTTLVAGDVLSEHDGVLGVPPGSREGSG